MSSSEERTEEATPRRRAKSQAQGMRASSALACSALALAAAIEFAHVALQDASGWLNAFRAAASAASGVMYHADPSALLLNASVISSESGFWQIVAYGWAATVFAAAGATLVCGSLGFAPAALLPATARLGARMGLRRLVNADSLTQTVGAFAAVMLVAMVVTPILFHNINLLAQIHDFSVQTLAAARGLAILWWGATAAVTLIAAVDVIVQRRKHATRLKMSPRELREERAQTEARPEARQRRRAVSARRLRGLRIESIRRATAVVANPTHFAVALRYAPPQIDVPIVVARAAGLMVPIVRAFAGAFGVPIVESPELARMLYLNVEVDEHIPDEYYAAVAAIFTWIIRTHGALRRGDEEAT